MEASKTPTQCADRNPKVATKSQCKGASFVNKNLFDNFGIVMVCLRMRARFLRFVP